jgi:hypothetical protein
MKPRSTRWTWLAACIVASLVGLLFVSGTTGKSQPRTLQSEPTPVQLSSRDAIKIARLKGDEPLPIGTRPPPAPKIPAPPSVVVGPTATPYFSDATPAGNGILLPYGPSQPMKGLNLHTSWRLVEDGKLFFIYSGGFQKDPTQGIIVVEEPSNDQVQRSLTMYPLAIGSGAVRIIGATGSILLLEGTNGQRFEFDVDLRTIVAK